jgi:gamma-glutamylcyclotransferase (GGCT)/AIG2-like uncharacterized protein YtfP
MNSEATNQQRPFFVYGTLMIGQPNAPRWRDCIQSVHSAHVDDYRLFDFGYYPVMIQEEGSKVFGQLVSLKRDCYDQILKDLDFLESFDPNHPDSSNYLRVKALIETSEGERLEAWTYIGVETHVQKLPPIDHGDWAKHIAGKDGTIATWWNEMTTVWDDLRRSNDS